MMRFLALILAPTVTANESALYLALHHDRNFLYFRAEDSDVAKSTLCGGAPHLIFVLATGHCAVWESLNRGMRPWRALPSWGEPEDCAHGQETRRKSLSLSHLIDKRA